MEENANEEAKKKIDEAWKEAVSREKDASQGPNQAQVHEVTFGIFLSGLMMEALVSLGDLENPISKKKDINLNNAKFIIDTLGMLKDKTRNNLSKDEAEGLEAVLYDLRTRFVGKKKL